MVGSEVECVASSQDGVAHHETIQWKCVRGDKASQPAIIAGSPTVSRQLHCLATRDDFANPLKSFGRGTSENFPFRWKLKAMSAVARTLLTGSHWSSTHPQVLASAASSKCRP